MPTAAPVRFLRPFGPKAHEFAFSNPSQDKFINILEGSVRSSKTWAMLVKFIQLLRYDVGGLKLLIGQTKSTIDHNVLSDIFTVVGKGNYSYSRQSGELQIFDDRWLVIGAKDEGSEKMIRGSTVGIAYIDEATLVPQSFWEMLLTRLSPEGARLYATTNPGTPYHYLRTTVLDNPDYKGLLWTKKFTLDDNPNISQQFKDTLKRTHKGVFYRRFILGEWVMAEGSIYGSSWDTGNTYTDFPTAPQLQAGVYRAPMGLYNAGGYKSRIIAVDYGTTNPMVFLEILDDGVVCTYIV